MCLYQMVELSFWFGLSHCLMILFILHCKFSINKKNKRIGSSVPGVFAKTYFVGCFLVCFCFLDYGSKKAPENNGLSVQ